VLPVDIDERHRIDRLAHLGPANLYVEVRVEVAAPRRIAGEGDLIASVDQLVGDQLRPLQEVA
jgi:hypothetical protein